jgi:hypothetical protein
MAHGRGREPSGTEQGGSDKQVKDAPDIGVKFYQIASKLIPDIITIASLESVQACLLLSHYTLPLDTHGLAYTYLGLTLKIAIQNGMHRKYTGNDFDSHTVEVRKRLWWTAYTLERYALGISDGDLYLRLCRRVCVMHGRPNSISQNDIDAELPRDLPAFRSSNQPSAFLNMSAMVYLSTRLGDVSHAM